MGLLLHVAPIGEILTVQSWRRAALPRVAISRVVPRVAAETPVLTASVGILASGSVVHLWVEALEQPNRAGWA